VSYDVPSRLEGWHVRHRGAASLEVSDFFLREENLAQPDEGEVLVRTRWLSLDPYLSFAMIGSGDSGASWPVQGRIIGEAVQSRAKNVPVGSTVLGTGQWREWNVLRGADVDVLPGDPHWPSTVHFGVLGASGLTAWVGMTLAAVQPGETILISAATGPVGSVCGQIARERGARVLGIAGGEEKCRLAVSRYGYDDCLDHRLPGLSDRLVAAAQTGIDVLFENVGAPSLDPALSAIVEGGRVILCGLAAHYRTGDPIALTNFRLILRKHLTMRGFAWTEHRDMHPAGRAWLTERLAEGTLAYDETVSTGLPQAAEAYVAMLFGKGLGKHLLQLP